MFKYLHSFRKAIIILYFVTVVWILRNIFDFIDKFQLNRSSTEIPQEVKNHRKQCFDTSHDLCVRTLTTNLHHMTVIRLKSTVITCYVPPNIWPNPVKGNIQMNFHIYICLKSANRRALHFLCNNTVIKRERLLRFFTSSVFIGWSRIHLDMTSNQVLSDVKGSIAYIYNSWL
jgi:hypothetical protein